MVNSTVVNHAFSGMSFIGIILVLVPFRWHLESWNTGTCLFMFWTALALFFHFVNSIIFDGNALDVAPIWCDIWGKLSTASSVALPAASFCIIRRLYKIASIKQAAITKQDKQRTIIIDCTIALGIPLLAAALQYIYQDNRYDIFEDFGCVASDDNSWPYYAFMLTWPVVLSSVSFFYGFMSIRLFWIRRAETLKYISSDAHKNLTSSRYFRLMGLAAADMFTSLPLGIYFIWYNATQVEFFPYSWDAVHVDFQTVNQYPAVLWRAQSGGSTVELTRWIYVYAAFIFFAFFGFSEEARKHYMPLLSGLTRTLGSSFGIKSTGFSSASGSKATNASTLTSSAATSTLQSKSRAPISVKTPNRPPKLEVTINKDSKVHRSTGAGSASTQLSFGDLPTALSDATALGDTSSFLKMDDDEKRPDSMVISPTALESAKNRDSSDEDEEFDEKHTGFNAV